MDRPIPHSSRRRAALEGVNRSIDAEISRRNARAKNDSEIAQQTEQSTRADYESAHVTAEQLNDKSVEFTIARQEANDSRALYRTARSDSRKAECSRGCGLPMSRWSTRAEFPLNAKPNVPVYLAIALVAGLFTGGGTSLLMDDSGR